MNAKTAKQLRKVARQLAESAGTEIIQHEQIENAKNRRKEMQQFRDENGQIVIGEDGTPLLHPTEVTLGTITNTETCIRGIYRNLKKAA